MELGERTQAALVPGAGRALSGRAQRRVVVRRVGVVARPVEQLAVGRHDTLVVPGVHGGLVLHVLRHRGQVPLRGGPEPGPGRYRFAVDPHVADGDEHVLGRVADGDVEVADQTRGLLGQRAHQLAHRAPLHVQRGEAGEVGRHLQGRRGGRTRTVQSRHRLADRPAEPAGQRLLRQAERL